MLLLTTEKNYTTEKQLGEIMEEYLTIKENFDIISRNIVTACEKTGRQNDVILLGASKMKDIYMINYSISQGLRYIGADAFQGVLFWQAALGAIQPR